MCEFSDLEHEVGEALKVVLRLQTNSIADEIVDLIGDFRRKAEIVRVAAQTATNADGSDTTPAWKAQVDKTMGEVLGINNPGRVDVAHRYLKPQPDGSITLQRPGKQPVAWSADVLNTKIETLKRLASEVATMRDDLTTLRIPVPTGWMSVDVYQPRQISPQLWDAILSTSGGRMPPAP